MNANQETSDTEGNQSPSSELKCDAKKTLETYECRCRWMCGEHFTDDVKTVINMVVNNMRNREVNGNFPVLDECVVLDKQTCSKIDGLNAISTNFACIVPFNFTREDSGLTLKVHKFKESTLKYSEKHFVLSVDHSKQTPKLIRKCIVQANRTDCGGVVDLLASRRMESSFLKSILHRSINRIHQDGALKPSDGRQVLLSFKEQAGFLILDLLFDDVDKHAQNTEEKILEFGLGSHELSRLSSKMPTHCQVSMIPSVNVNVGPCQYFVPLHQTAKAMRSVTKTQQAVAKQKNDGSEETASIQETIATQNEHIWALVCVEEHDLCPEAITFSSEDDLAINVPCSSKTRPDASSIDLLGRRLSTEAALHCESIRTPASRLLLEYYYRFGDIPEQEMQIVCEFVMGVLQNLEKSIQGDRAEGDAVLKDFFRCGSSAEGLKVCSPNEFDIMIPIEISETHPSSYSVICQPDFPLGYAVCKVHSRNSFSERLGKCVVENRLFGQLLSPEKLAFNWFQGLVQRAINKYKSEHPSVSLKCRRKGPALMLEIETSMPGIPKHVDVDLVLAIKMTNENVPRLAVAKASSLEAYYKTKLKEKGESSGTKESMDLQDDDLKCFWRISYSVQEKCYLDIVQKQQVQQGFPEGCQKVCLKILKAIRERELLKKSNSVMGQKLNSYLLKTCLYHVLATKSSPSDWQYECLADRYLDVFNFFVNCLEEDMLPHFFYDKKHCLGNVFPGMIWNVSEDRVNLLTELHSTLRDQIYSRMTQILESFQNAMQFIDKNTKKSSRLHQDSSTLQPTNRLRSFGERLENRTLPSANSERLLQKASDLRMLAEDHAGETTIITASNKVQASGHSTPKGSLSSEFQLTEYTGNNPTDEIHITKRRQATSHHSHGYGHDEADSSSMVVGEACLRTNGDIGLDVLAYLLKDRSLEQIVHPDFEARPWCKRPCVDDGRTAEIARRMAKQTRKYGVEDFEQLKTKCTAEVEKAHEQEEESDDEYWDDYNQYDRSYVDGFSYYYGNLFDY